MEDNIKMDLKEIGCEGVDSTNLVGFCQDGNEPSGSIKGEESAPWSWLLGWLFASEFSLHLF
jgi:hypothetical protein